VISSLGHRPPADTPGDLTLPVRIRVMPNRFGRTNHFGGKPSTSDADRSQGSRGYDTSGGRCCRAAPVAGGEAIHRRTPTGAFRNHAAGHARQALVSSGTGEWMRVDASRCATRAAQTPWVARPATALTQSSAHALPRSSATKSWAAVSPLFAH